MFVTVLGLAQLHLSQVAKLSPLRSGLAFWPMPLGLIVAATAFGLLFRTRWVPVLVNAGLIALAAGAASLLWLSPSDPLPVVAAASAALGFGAGATVSPGLFLAAMGVLSQRLGRAFALVTLLRIMAAYAVTPVVTYAARQDADRPTASGPA